MYKIGEFSLLTKTTVKTLRFYDEAGLLSPEDVDDMTGYRYYSTKQLFALQRILALRQTGLSVEEIKRVNSGCDVKEILSNRKLELQKEKDETEKKLVRISNLIKFQENNMQNKYEAVVKTLPDYTVYYKHGRIKGFENMVQFILESGEECLAANPDIKCVQPDYCYVAYLEPEYKDKDILIEYAQAVLAAGKETESIKFRRLAPVKAVCVYHKGAYEGLRDAYAFAFDFVEKNGYVAIEPPRERYIDGMWNKENAEDWLTEIQIPVK